MPKKINLIGRRFNRLLVVENVSSSIDGYHKWRCICDCGNEKNIRTGDLNSGRTQSCGCLNKENLIEKTKKANLIRTKYSPSIASGKTVFNKYYNDGDLSFEKFLELCKQNCFYCDCKPNNKSNRFINRDSYYTVYRIQNGHFIYNGLDRLDSSFPHNIDNVVTCCKYCNWAKNNLSVEKFFSHIECMFNHRGDVWSGSYTNIKSPLIYLDNRAKDIYLPQKSELVSGLVLGKLTIINSAVKVEKSGRKRKAFLCRCECGIEKIFIERILLNGRARSCGSLLCKRKNTPQESALKKAWQTSYNDDLLFEQFKILSQMNCYYCNSKPLNMFKGNISDDYFSYNGLDRLDSSLSHNIDNVVPCCKICNNVKNDRSLSILDNWLTTVYNKIYKIRMNLYVANR